MEAKSSSSQRARRAGEGGEMRGHNNIVWTDFRSSLEQVGGEVSGHHLSYWSALRPSGTLVPTFAGVRNSRKVRYMVKLGEESISRYGNLNIRDNARLHADSITPNINFRGYTGRLYRSPLSFRRERRVLE